MLKRLYEADLINEKQYKQALVEVIVTPKPTVKIGRAPYFIDFVKYQLADLYPQEVLQSEGLRIFTTLNMTMQLIAEGVLKKDLKKLEERFGKALPEGREGELQGVLIAMQPTRGLDVGSTKYVHQCILDHREKGGATLYISTELDELLAISDRIAVMYEGRIMGILPAGENLDFEQISLMMAGIRQDNTE